MKNKIVTKVRRRREAIAFQRVLDNASPSMRSELVAMAQRQNYVR
jgi:hypothetical protein